MNPLAYFALELSRQAQQQAERAILLRRKRVGDDEPPALARDRLWAAAIHRFAVRSETAPPTDARETAVVVTSSVAEAPQLRVREA